MICTGEMPFRHDFIEHGIGGCKHRHIARRGVDERLDVGSDGFGILRAALGVLRQTLLATSTGLRMAANGEG